MRKTRKSMPGEEEASMPRAEEAGMLKYEK